MYVAESWVHCNDSRLEQCPLSEVMQSQAYILFYTLKPPRGSTESLLDPGEAQEFEEEADDEITFNFINSTIPKYIEMKKRLIGESPTQTELKRRRSTLW